MFNIKIEKLTAHLLPSIAVSDATAQYPARSLQHPTPEPASCGTSYRRAAESPAPGTASAQRLALAHVVTAPAPPPPARSTWPAPQPLSVR